GGVLGGLRGPGGPGGPEEAGAVLREPEHVVPSAPGGPPAAAAAGGGAFLLPPGAAPSSPLRPPLSSPLSPPLPSSPLLSLPSRLSPQPGAFPSPPVLLPPPLSSLLPSSPSSPLPLPTPPHPSRPSPRREPPSPLLPSSPSLLPTPPVPPPSREPPPPLLSLLLSPGPSLLPSPSALAPPARGCSWAAGGRGAQSSGGRASCGGSLGYPGAEPRAGDSAGAMGQLCCFPFSRDEEKISELESPSSTVLQRYTENRPSWPSGAKNGGEPDDAELLRLSKRLVENAVLKAVQQYLEETQSRGKPADGSSGKARAADRGGADGDQSGRQEAHWTPGLNS
uniref:A-kinase anchoring protein 7 n=1 Tax=Canis lupus familiaris TaxID=9615 RepID=A0A8C0RCW8_CANLF